AAAAAARAGSPGGAAQPTPGSARGVAQRSRQQAPRQLAEEWVKHKMPSKDVQGHSLFGPPERTLPAPPEGLTVKASEAQTYERALAWHQKKEEKNKQRAKEKLVTELSTLRNPKITEKSKFLATSYKSGPPPMAERARRRIEEARAKEESECTFRPQVCKGTRQMHATMLHSGAQWHSRLQPQHVRRDRMGCRARRDADVDADCTFSPRLSPMAQLLVRDGTFQLEEEQNGTGIDYT
ncbi:unnamed protein product, partial [Prorocentrum cordatum]